LEHKYREAEQPLLAAYRAFSKQTPQPADRIASTCKDLVDVYDHMHEEGKASIYRIASTSRTTSP